MAGQRLRTGNMRAMLKYWGINSAADKTEKPPDLCYQDFHSWINGAGTGIIPAMGHSSAVLVSTTKKNLVSIPLPAANSMGAYVRATTIATDGTDMQAFTELIELAAVNKAGTYTKTVTNLSTVGAKAVSAGTLTTSWGLDDGTNAVTLTLTATTSLTTTSFVVHFEFGMSHSTSGADPSFL